MANQRAVIDTLLFVVFFSGAFLGDSACSLSESECIAADSNNPSDVSGLIQMRMQPSEHEDFIQDAVENLAKDANEGDDEFRDISGGDDSKACKRKCIADSGLEEKFKQCRKESRGAGGRAKIRECMKKSVTPELKAELKACKKKCKGAGLLEEQGDTEDTDEFLNEYAMDDIDEFLGEDADDLGAGAVQDDEFRAISGGDDSKACKRKCIADAGLEEKFKQCRKESRGAGGRAKIRECMKKSVTPELKAELKACKKKCKGAGLLEEQGDIEDTDEFLNEYAMDDIDEFLGEDADDLGADSVQDDEFRGISGGDDSKACKRKCIADAGLEEKLKQCRKESRGAGGRAKIRECMKKSVTPELKAELKACKKKCDD